MKNKKSQSTLVIEHIKEYGNLSTLEAFQKYQIVRLGSIINVLRKEGYLIKTIMEKNKNTNKRYARYYIDTN